MKLFAVLQFKLISTGTIFAAVFALGMFFAPSAAHAINGRDAVGVCIDSTASGARCGWNVNEKGEIDICNKSGCVYCASAESQCVVANAKRPHPTRGLPVGAQITTSLGTFKVSSRKPTGPILKDPPTENKP